MRNDPLSRFTQTARRGLGGRRRGEVGRVFGVRFARGWFAALLATGMAVSPLRAASSTEVRGLPFMRSYPYEEIGNVSRGASLDFDAFGRLAVIHDGAYVVLNDTVWVDLVSKAPEHGTSMTTVVQGPAGEAYYGGRGSWGTVETTPDGHLTPSPLVPADAPAWARSTAFAQLVTTAHGVYFAGPNGIVYWDRSKRVHQFFEVNNLARLFSVGDRAYVSAHAHALMHVDTEAGVLREVPGNHFSEPAVSFAVDLDGTSALCADGKGRLYQFDGTQSWPWEAQSRHKLTGTIAALKRLADGGVALAITGKGLFLFNATGELVSSLTTPQFHRITSLACREPGVLWVASEEAIDRVLYGSPLTTFGQRLGIAASWPIVVRWNDRIIVSSAGQLYEAVPGGPGEPSRFELRPNQIQSGAWALASNGTQLLVGNMRGVFAAERDGTFTPVASTKDVSRLVMIGSDLCYAIGRTEIAVLRWADGRWSECAPRIEGIGYPAVVRPTRQSVWMELGGNKVARVRLENDRLDLRTYDDLPWPDAQWVNVGIAGGIVMLSGFDGGRLFLDEQTGAYRSAPLLEQLLDRSPYAITRVQEDESGTIWATHTQGVVAFTPTDSGYEMDATTFDLINDHYPAVQLLPGNDVWISAGRALHHVERRRTDRIPQTTRPALVSVTDAATGVELLDRRSPPAGALRLRYDQNSLSFRLFSGTYTWRRAPVYQYRLHPGDRWVTSTTGPMFGFSEMREGTYQLEVRLAGSQESLEPVRFDFEVLPPWHRTWPAYIGYGLGLVLFTGGLARWASQQARRHSTALERLVRERTGQLEETMAKLNEETRHAATLAERDRLAGEIHDSLQQGLSGLILHLDATLKLPTISGDLRSRLNVARNMVSFTRHEVQHAVWDMESPLLEDTELGEALRKLTALIGPGSATIEIAVSGVPVTLPSSLKHHLLRIAQEAITNAVRHAAATRIAVELTYQPEKVALLIRDDGKGFDPDEVLRNGIGHFGLRGLRSRTAKIRGELSIQSAAAQGTAIRVIVPVTNQEAVPAGE